MTEGLALVRLSADVGQSWVIGSLNGGGPVSKPILSRHPSDHGTFSVIAPPSIRIEGIESLNRMNQITVEEPAWPLLAIVIEEWVSAGAECFVVEADLSTPEDLSGPFGSRSISLSRFQTHRY